MRLSDIGLHGGMVHELGYHEPTSTVIALVGQDRMEMPANRLYFRHAGDSYYQPVATLPDGISIDSHVLDPLRPAIYFSTSRWEVMSPKSYGAYWDGLYRFDLEEHRCDRLADDGDLTGPDGCERVWISELLSASADGAALFGRAGFEFPDPSTGGERVEYWIARLNLRNNRLEKVSRLPISFA
jgi:hypothetical protein